jgi:hypothetical protein
MIGQDGQGNWVVQDQTGGRGGIFVDRIQALKFARSENGNQPPAFVIVSGVLELDLTDRPMATPQTQFSGNARGERRVA